jgi:hypothetical protein
VLRWLVTERDAGSGVQDSASGPAADFDIIFFFVVGIVRSRTKATEFSLVYSIIQTNPGE